MPKGEEKRYVVLTEFKEIFCGWSSDVSGDRIKLRDARLSFVKSNQPLCPLNLTLCKLS